MTVLDDAYGAVLDQLPAISDDVGWRPTGCAGWTVRDLLFHLLSDTQRALVALGTPAEGPADVDAVTYWAPWQPGTEGAAKSQRATRIMASNWTSVRSIADLYAETARAVLVGMRRLPGDSLVATQGHVLTVDDLASTLAVEATVHQLDLGLGVASASGLAEVRRVLEGLLGRAAPAEWDSDRYALVGTGRAELTEAERAWLGADADRLPLFG